MAAPPPPPMASAMQFQNLLLCDEASGSLDKFTYTKELEKLNRKVRELRGCVKDEKECEEKASEMAFNDTEFLMNQRKT